MNPRGLRRYIDDLLRGRRPKPFRPDDFEAAQIRTAIDLQAARLGSDAPRQEFLTDLRRRLAAQQDGAAQPTPKSGATRRNVIVGTSAAAAAAVAAVSIDRALIDSAQVADGDNSRLRGAHPEHRTLDAGRRQRRCARRGHAALRSRLGHRLRAPRRRQARSRVRGVHPSGLPVVVRRARRPAALPLSFDVFFARRPGADSSTADCAETVAHVDGSRARWRNRGIRTGAAERAGLTAV